MFGAAAGPSAAIFCFAAVSEGFFIGLPPDGVVPAYPLARAMGHCAAPASFSGVSEVLVPVAGWAG